MRSIPSAALLLATTAAALAGCGSMTTSAPMAAFDQAALPDPVRVPAGHRVAMETVGVGEITYECREKVNPPAGQPAAYEWVFVGPRAVLNDRAGRAVGSYYGPPATWASADGSAITGAQLAVAPALPGSIPLQLVKANPATGSGTAMKDVAYIQRVATQGGVAPSRACRADALGQRETVRYQADYIFWKAA